MKTNKLVILFLSFSFLCDASDDPLGLTWTVWASKPVRFFVDANNAPTGLPNNSATRNHIIGLIENWNNNSSLGSLVRVSQGQFNNYSDVLSPDTKVSTNNQNQVFYNTWYSNDQHPSFNAIGITRRYYSQTDDTITARLGFKPENYESDIIINPNYTFFAGSPASSCNNKKSLDVVIMHEIGHGLGFRHNVGDNSIMSRNSRNCETLSLTTHDWDLAKRIYRSRDTVDIDIQSPANFDVLIANQLSTFSANIVPLGSARRTLSAETLKSLEDNLVWSSSIDGDFAYGNDQEVNVSNLSEGLHTLTVKLGEPGDTYFGDGASSFHVVDRVVTTDQDAFHPFPCPRVRDIHGGEYCLLTTTNKNRLACETYNPWPYTDPYGYKHGPYWSKDVYTETGFGTSVDPYPICNNRDDYDYNFYSYINSPDNLVQFQLYYELHRKIASAGNSIRSVHYFNANIPIVDSEVTLSPITDCNVGNATQKCGVTIQWEDLFFAPDAGIYYRNSPFSNWQLLKRISERNGSYTTGNIVSVDGVEFAVFQHSKDIRKKNSYGGLGTVIIDAPNGMMAGPVQVKAIAADTTPVPKLNSVAALGTTTYKVELIGDNFGVNSATDLRVSVREDIDGSQPLAVYSSAFFHNQGTHVSGHVHEGKNFIRFPVLKTSRQSKFRVNGLCFKVLSDSLVSNEVCYKIPARSSKPNFAAGPVQSYNHTTGAQDIDNDAYVVKADGSMLKLWGNSWKKVPMQYTVTPNTELKMNFKSTHGEAEIAGVGFILQGESDLSSTRFWQLHGDQPGGWGIQDHNNYTGTTHKPYSIKIGQKFTGQISHMVFVADHDNQQIAQNVVFQTPVIREDIDQYDNVSIRGYTDDVPGDAVPLGAGDTQTHNFHDSGDQDWTIFGLGHGKGVNVNTTQLGTASAHMRAYRVVGAFNEVSPGRWDITTSDLILIDTDLTSSNNTLTIQNTSGATQFYMIKTTSSGPYGFGTDYQIHSVWNNP